MPDDTALVLLAAGGGSRLAGLGPKPLVPLLGRRLVDYPLRAMDALLSGPLGGRGRVAVVVGHEGDRVAARAEGLGGLSAPPAVVRQERQDGTADALEAWARSGAAGGAGAAVVMGADAPLVGPGHLERLLRAFLEARADAALASFRPRDPSGYGRVVRGGGGGGGGGVRVVEERDADRETRRGGEANGGVYVFRTPFLREALPKVGSTNRAGERYITDLFPMAGRALALEFPDGDAFHGVNTPADLGRAQDLLRGRRAARLADGGVRLLDARSAFIDEDAEVGEGALLHPNVSVLGASRLGPGAVVEPGALLIDSAVGAGSTVRSGTRMEGASVGRETSVGPFAHLRPGTVVGDGCRVGNFVEVKNSTLKDGCKVSHLSYVGDAEVGRGANVGCGFITCNYDGRRKHRTVIGDRAFIGSDTQAVAPVRIGHGCYVASGSTINRSLADGDFAIARARQVVKPGMAARFLGRGGGGRGGETP